MSGATDLKPGILLVDKPAGKTSFSLVHALRKKTGIQKIGHAGTLDPFATGLMVMLIGKEFTKKSDELLTQDKEYLATAYLGIATDSYDRDGQETARSSVVPTLEEIEKALPSFQGTFLQTPPMFSAKKVGGKKLYELARKGKTIERQQVAVTAHIRILSYTYPELTFHLTCSKGTYVRAIAHDLGALLGSYAHLIALRRLRSGPFQLKDAIDGTLLYT